MATQWEEEPLEVERYELHETKRYAFEPDRREFLQTLGAGLWVAVAVEVHPAVAQPPRGRGGPERTARRAERLSDRFHIGVDGIVTVFTSKVEVGQGSRTQITQAAAEELDLPVDRIQLIMADTERCPDDGGTAGSRTTPATVPRVRQAAASVRQRLIEYAAKRLGVEKSTIRFEDGVFRTAAGPSLALADLAKGEGLAAELAHPAGDVSIKRVDEWKVLGQATPKVNGRDVVTGAARYPSDLVRPGMVYGKVLRPPAYHARLKSIDLAPAQALEGVTVVRDGEFVGCTAPTTWQAQRALEALAETATWENPPPQPSSDGLFEHLKKHAAVDGQGGGRQRGRSGSAWGDRTAALAKAAKRLQAAYTVAYIQHAPMEPRAALAEWHDGKLTVWTGSQQPSRVQGELCQAFRLPPDRVRVVVPDTGGGFGGKHSGEAAVEAARLAKAAGKPVSLRWTREEEFTWAYFRPAGLIEVHAGLDDGGGLLVWDFANYNSGGSALETPYRIPHGRTRFLSTDSPLRQGSYRALASTANTFARESAMDELAHLAGADPLAFRLQHLPDGRLKDVLKAAAERFRWNERIRARSAHRGIGLACGTEKGSYVAACAEVEVVAGTIKVLSVCEAYECGAIQNPSNLRAQVEGAILQGLGGALTEAITFKDGKITNPNFSSYRVPRMRDTPELDLVLLDRRDLPPVGAGETPIIAVAPAVANAVFNAVGKRLRGMPLRL